MACATRHPLRPAGLLFAMTVALFACKQEAPPSPTVNDIPIDRARQAEREGRPAEVRRLLEEGVRGGTALPEEIRLVRAACKAQKDQACLDDLLGPSSAKGRSGSAKP